MEYENTFVREVKEKNITNPFEILNWYRNLYHTEDNHIEQGIVAYAINDVFVAYKDYVPKAIVNLIFEDIFLCSEYENGRLVIDHDKIVGIKNQFQRRLKL